VSKFTTTLVITCDTEEQAHDLIDDLLNSETGPSIDFDYDLEFLFDLKEES